MPAADNLSIPSELVHLYNVENLQLNDLIKIIQIKNAIIQSQEVQINCLRQEVETLRKGLQDQSVALAALYSVCAIPSTVAGSPDLPRNDVEREEEVFSAVDKSVVEKFVYETQPVDKNDAILSTETQPAPEKFVYEQAEPVDCNDNIISNEDGSFKMLPHKKPGKRLPHIPSAQPFFDMSVERYVAITMNGTTYQPLRLTILEWQALAALVRAGSQGLTDAEFGEHVEWWNGKNPDGVRIQRVLSRLTCAFRKKGIRIQCRVQNVHPTHNKSDGTFRAFLEIIPEKSEKSV